MPFSPASPMAYTITFSSSARFITSFNDLLWLLKFIGASTPSVNTSTTRRPCSSSSLSIARSTAFHSGVGPSLCKSFCRIFRSVCRSDVNSVGSIWMLVEKLPMRALSSEPIARTKASAARSSSAKFGFMLPLRSSSMTTVMG